MLNETGKLEIKSYILIYSFTFLYEENYVKPST